MFEKISSLLPEYQASLINNNDFSTQTVIAKVIKLKEIKTKDKKLMAFATINDGINSLEVIIWPSEYQEIINYDGLLMLRIEFGKKFKKYVIKNIKKII